MKNSSLYLMAAIGAAFTLPGTSIAQTSADSASAQYCNALAKKYSEQRHLYEVTTADKAVAVARCQTDPQDSIATLELAMKNAKIDLPPRDQAVTAAPNR